MPKIKEIKAREILDSSGNPTVEVVVFLDNGLSAKASVPSSSNDNNQGIFELRDGDSKRYRGLGVLRAVEKIKEVIFPSLLGLDVTKQSEIDKILIELDGTETKKNLGVNSMLAVSLACARAAAISSKQELFLYLQKTFEIKNSPKIPQPLFNIFNGGKHADTNLDFQEFLLIPKKTDTSKMIQIGSEIFHELGRVLKESNYDTDTGLEGGYAPDLDSSIEAIELILAAAIRVGYIPGKDLHLGIDVGSNILYEEKNKKYLFPLDNSYFSSTSLLSLYNDWFKKYPLIYLEDALSDSDWEGWRELTRELGDKMMIVGDELFSSKPNFLRRGLKEKAANSIVIKPNQLGTLTETVDCIRLAQKHGYKVIISHRGGETVDDFIVDLAVAAGADYLKAGSLSRGERLAKYNRLLEIAEIIE